MAKHTSSIDFSGVAKATEFDPIIVERVFSKLDPVQRLALRLQGHVEVGHIRMKGWKAEMPCYLFKCEEHGYQINVPSGYQMNLICPKCIKEVEAKTKESEIHHQISGPSSVETDSNAESYPLPLPIVKNHK